MGMATARAMDAAAADAHSGHALLPDDAMDKENVAANALDAGHGVHVRRTTRLAAKAAGAAGPEIDTAAPGCDHQQANQTTAQRSTHLRERGHRDAPEERIYECVLDAHGFVTNRCYIKGRFLGKGGFARCYELTCEQTKRKFAGKIVAKSSLVKAKAKQKFTSEIKIHKALHHPKIVQFEHFFEDNDNAYILLELCKNQSLSDLLRRRKRLSEGEVRFYIRQLVEGIAHLHANLVIHRDLKLGNLFLTEDMELKIGDFGLAARLDNMYDRKKTMCGTPNYIAPEILDGQKGDGHSFEVDIWSTGVVMYTLLVGRPPFETSDVKDTYKRIRANQYSFPDDVELSDSAKSLIQEILCIDPLMRPTCKAILAHSFLQDEPIPTYLPRTALLVTPPDCKRGADGGHATTPMQPDRFANARVIATTGPPSSAHARPLPRYPLRQRDVNTSPAVASARASPAAPRTPSPAAAKASPAPAPAPTTSEERTLASSGSGDTVPLPGTPEHAAAGPPRDLWETVYDTLTQYFFLLDHGASGEKLSEFSSATTLVAAARRLKQLRVEHDARHVVVPALLWVSQWVDYTTKYGMGYMLSNGSAGVYFNDSTKMIASADASVFEYLERRPDAATTCVHYPMDQYDPTLKKKVILLGHFRGYLLDAQGQNNEAQVLERELGRLPETSAGFGMRATKNMAYVKKWVKTRHAVLFMLSNDSFQFNFYDDSKLVLSHGGRTTTYLTKDGHLEVHATSISILSNENSGLLKRLRYARDMLQQMVRATSAPE